MKLVTKSEIEELLLASGLVTSPQQAEQVLNRVERAMGSVPMNVIVESIEKMQMIGIERIVKDALREIYLSRNGLLTKMLAGLLEPSVGGRLHFDWSRIFGQIIEKIEAAIAHCNVGYYVKIGGNELCYGTIKEFFDRRHMPAPLAKLIKIGKAVKQASLAPSAQSLELMPIVNVPLLKRESKALSALGVPVSASSSTRLSALFAIKLKVGQREPNEKLFGIDIEPSVALHHEDKLIEMSIPALTQKLFKTVR